MPAASRQPTPDAEVAFADYVALGAGRSLAKLHERYRNATEPTPTKRLKTLKEWSSRYGWQDRVRQAATAAAEHMLEEAARLDAETFLLTSQHLNERTKISTPMHAELLVKIRESVRKPAPKGGTTVGVNVTVDVAVRQMVERIAEEEGVEPDELMADIEHFLASERA